MAPLISQAPLLLGSQLILLAIVSDWGRKRTNASLIVGGLLVVIFAIFGPSPGPWIVHLPALALVLIAAVLLRGQRLKGKSADDGVDWIAPTLLSWALAWISARINPGAENWLPIETHGLALIVAAVLTLGRPSEAFTVFLVVRSGVQSQDQTSEPAVRMVGGLERIFVLILILMGKPEGVAVLAALKGLVRAKSLEEEQNQGKATYYLLGTLASLLAALLVSSLAAYALGPLWFELGLMQRRGLPFSAGY